MSRLERLVVPGRLVSCLALVVALVIGAWCCLADGALAIVPGDGEELSNGTAISSPCSETNKSTEDEEQFWILATVNPKRQLVKAKGELAPEKLPRLEEFNSEYETFYSPQLEGEEFPSGSGGGCSPVQFDPTGTEVQGNELALYVPGPYVLEQVTEKVKWELVKFSSPAKKCGNDDKYYPDPAGLEHPEFEPPEPYGWEITSYCNTVKVINFDVLGGKGLCPTTQDYSQWPAVPYFSQYDAGAALGLPIGAERAGGNACGPSSLLMAMRSNLEFTAEREGWSGEELSDAIMGLPALTKVFDETMEKTREQVKAGEGNRFIGDPKALDFLRSLGWSQAKPVELGSSLADITGTNEIKIESALMEGPIVINTAFGVAPWGKTGGGHVIMVFGPDPNHGDLVDVYDPAGNYFSTPNGGYSNGPKHGHYGPGSCGYDVPYPLSWLLAYTTERGFLKLGPASAVDPPVISISDTEPVGANAPESFYLQDAEGQRSGWVAGQAVEEIPGAFVGQAPNFPSNPGAGDPEVDESLLEEPVGPAPRSVILASPPAGTTLHASDQTGGNFALEAEQWSDGTRVSREVLSGSLLAGQDTPVPSPALNAAISASQQTGGTQEHNESAGAGSSNGQGTTTPRQGSAPAREAKTPPVPDALLASRSLTVSPSGAVVLEVSCPAAETSCTGTITLRTLTAVSASSRRKGKPAILTLATGSFTVPGGHVRAITLHLSEQALVLLARTHLLRARATITAHDPAGAKATTQSTVTLRPAKAKRKR